MNGPEAQMYRMDNL